VSNFDVPVKEVGDMLDLVSEKLPNLIKGLYQTLFSEEVAQTMSSAVGTFHKNLIAAGMDRKDALLLTQDYLDTLTGLVNQSFNQKSRDD